MNKDQLLTKLATAGEQLAKCKEDNECLKRQLEEIGGERNQYFLQAREARMDASILRESLEDIAFVKKGLFSGRIMRIIAEGALSGHDGV